MNDEFPKCRKLSELINFGENDPSELIQHRFLCKGGIMELVGPTGIGKSSISMQLAVKFALGKPEFGFVPKRELKSLIIQSENDDGDMAEFRDGMFEGLNLTNEERAKAGESIFTVNLSVVGSKFFEALEKYLLETKPDLVWIDPVFAFIGGDASSQVVAGEFLRENLLPTLKKHGCASILIHHTNKTGQNDNAYAGSGSAEFANASRAVLVLKPARDGMFTLTAEKRGKRLRWKMPDGVTFRDFVFLKHSSREGIICWEKVEGSSDVASQLKPVLQPREQIRMRVPESGTISKEQLLALVNSETGIGINAIRNTMKAMEQNGDVFVVKKPRTTGPPEIHYSLKPDEKSQNIAEIFENLKKMGIEIPEKLLGSIR